MTPKDSDPAQLGRDDEDPTSPSSASDWGDDGYDDGDTPLTDTMDQNRVDKIDLIMQSFCEALDSKLVLVKKEKPSPIKPDQGSPKREQTQDEEEDKESEKKREIEEYPCQEDKEEPKPGHAPQAPTGTQTIKGVTGLPLLQKFTLKKRSVPVATSASLPAPSATPTAFAGAPRPRGAIRLAPGASQPVAESDSSAPPPPPPPPEASSSAPPPPPLSSQAPAPAPAPTASRSSVSAPAPTQFPTTASIQPPPPPIRQPGPVGGGGGGLPPGAPSLPSILPSSLNLLHSQFFHLPFSPPASFPSAPSRSPPTTGFGAAAQNLQQTPIRPPVPSIGQSQSLRSRQPPNVPFGRSFQSSARSLASHEPDQGELSFGAAHPPASQWQPTPTLGSAGMINPASFSGPQVGSRGLDQEGLSSPDFTSPFHSPPNPIYDSFTGESLQRPGASVPGELYQFPAPEPGGSRRQYQFGTSPSVGEQENDSYQSRKSSAVSPFATSSVSPAAAQPALDKAPDRDGRRKRQKATDDSTPKSGEKKFACPYYKRNRKKYCKWTSCPGPGWEEVHRVKTHLYRRHGRPPQCPRCWTVFSTDEALQAHQQQDPPCETSQNVGLVEGFSKEQEKKLRSRKKAQPNMTDEDKWRDIYMILFPDDDKDSIPSPYYDETDGGDREDSGGTNADSPSGELDDYAAFVRREMPTLVRRELEILFESELKDIDDKLKPRVAKIVLDLQPKLLDLYKQSQLPLSEYGPQNPGQVAAGQTPGSGSEPGMASTVSPGSGIDTNSTPGGLDNNISSNDGGITHETEDVPYYDPAAFDFDINNMGTGLTWDGSQYQFQNPTTDPGQYQGTTINDGAFGGGAGLDWNFEFDQLLNPALLVPADASLLAQGYGEANEWGKRKHDGN